MTTAPTFDTLPINVLFPHPANVRRELTGIDELAESIRTEGLHQPLVVTPRLDGDDGYTVVMGHRRLAASRTAGKIHAPCIIRTDLDTEAKVLSAMLAENCARNDLTITEEGDAFQRLLDLDLSAATVAKRAGRSRKQVADRVTIAGQPEKIRQAVDDRQITLANALTLAELSDDHELYKRVEQAIGTPRFEYEVQRALVIRRHTKDRDEQRAELLAAGYVEAAADEPVEGFRVERLFLFEPDGPEDSLRFYFWFPSPEHQAPHVRWHRLVPVEPKIADGPSEEGTPPAAELTADQRTEREAALARIEQARAEVQERTTAADRRRAHLTALWKVDFNTADAVWTPAVEQLLRRAVTERGYDWEPLSELAIIIDPEDPAMDDNDPRLSPSNWSVLQLQFAVWWCRWAAMGERELSNYHPNNWEPETATYLETLRDLLEYELSDIEDAFLDTYRALTDGDGDD